MCYHITSKSAHPHTVWITSLSIKALTMPHLYERKQSQCANTASCTFFFSCEANPIVITLLIKHAGLSPCLLQSTAHLVPDSAKCDWHKWRTTALLWPIIRNVCNKLILFGFRVNIHRCTKRSNFWNSSLLNSIIKHDGQCGTGTQDKHKND